MNLLDYDYDSIIHSDNLYPGPWQFCDNGQNGYQIIDAKGQIVESGRHGAEDNYREALIDYFNQQVAARLANLESKAELSAEFFQRKHNLICRSPVFAAESAAKVGEAYRAIGKPLIADAISGVRYGKKLFRDMKKYRASEDKKKTPPFMEFISAHAVGYFTIKNIGSSDEEIAELLSFFWIKRIKIFLEAIKNIDPKDEAKLKDFSFSLISVFNLAGMDIVELDADSVSSDRIDAIFNGYSISFSAEDRELINKAIEQYGEDHKENCVSSAKKNLQDIRDGLSEDWHILKLKIVAGRLTSEEIKLTSEEEQRLKGIFPVSL